ncbi:MAG: transcriptional repressor [Clostridia bacterium]|nr:transcriptional repressor [Clostridia bacterium]
MAEYKTQQKQQLLDYLSKNRERPLRVEDISAGLAAAYADAPGKSTVYRLVNRLYEEGRLKRFEQGSSRTFVYQLADGEACHSHLHLKCTACGKLLHMDNAQSEKLLQEILGGSDFAVDREETTLFGTCRDCMQQERGDKTCRS